MIIIKRQIGIKQEKILKEINFNNIEEINNIGTMVGTEYSLEPFNKTIDYAFRWTGGNLLDINLEESEILQNSEFTIVAKVKINRGEQSSVNSMGILGNHTATTGIVWQFLNTSNTLELGISTSGQLVGVDYTNYYDKYTDIVMTYKDNTITVYMDGIKYGSLENITLVSNGKLYIGCSYGNTSRGMKGYLPDVKIWSKALTQSEISNLKLEEVNTKIQPNNILREMKLQTPSEVEANGTLANNSYKIYMIAK